MNKLKIKLFLLIHIHIILQLLQQTDYLNGDLVNSNIQITTLQ
jgi:hypothetical protein